jgi:hypothetical protein
MNFCHTLQPLPGFRAQEYRNIPLESYTSSLDVLGTFGNWKAGI